MRPLFKTIPALLLGLLLISLSGFRSFSASSADDITVFPVLAYMVTDSGDLISTDGKYSDYSDFENVLTQSDNFFLQDSTDNPDSTIAIDSLSLVDSTIIIDSVAFADSLWLDSLSQDSTARMKQFTHKRTDSPALSLFQKRQSPFYVNPTTRFFKRTVDIDSTGEFMVVKDEVAGIQQKNELKIPISTYIDLKRKDKQRKMWEELGYAYELKASAKDLSELISDFTNFTIPLPPNPVLSVFGPPVIDLRISGAVDIHGAWRNEKTEGVSSSRLGNTRNEPDFKQQVQINVSGTIGDKLSINADWNTERTFEYENQLKIQYTGYEDEIVQSIEAGNVSLQTSPLVGGSEALFGIKAKFQMGPFSLTALASQKKGEIEEVSVSGGSSKQEFELHAYDYSKNHYFIHPDYANRDIGLFQQYFDNITSVEDPEYYVQEIEVWRTKTGIIDQLNEREVRAHINLRALTSENDSYSESLRTTETDPGIVEAGRFIKLEEGIDYTIHKETGFLSFRQSLQETDAIAVAFRRQVSGTDFVYGEFLASNQDTAGVMVLQLVKPKNLQPSYDLAWDMQLKNIYPIGGRDIKQEGFVLDIRRIIEGGDPQDEEAGKKYVTEFRLDKENESGSSQPDGAFDYNPGKTIIPATGEIIFPVLQPFGLDYPEELDLELIYQQVYDTTVTFAKQERALDKYIITGEYSASVSSVYNIGFNVVQNSVKVRLNGNELREGADYAVDYNIGQITIRNDAALVPGADLKITYEKNDLVQLASKTLVGFRGLYEFSKDTRLGFSFLNLNEQTLSDKVRIGEEPLNNTMYGVDFTTNQELPFLTSFVDNFLSTKTMSRWSLKGEYAYIDPEPNTKESTISSDGGASIAYIDDFEGAKKIIPIGISDRAWRDLSAPNRLIPNGQTASDFMAKKGKAYWFNILPSDVNVQDIWGDRKQVSRDDEQVTVLDMVYLPTEKGMYNLYPELESNPLENWGGMMKGLSSSANNLIEENVEFIEFWLQVREAPDDARFYIDLGLISEDVIPNGDLDTEDENNNDLEEESEDIGIDRLPDNLEDGYDPVSNRDPAGDNFAIDLSGGKNGYKFSNGLENNAAYRNAGIKLPDSEDLNRNLTLETANSYFTYEVSLDTSVSDNKFIIGEGEKGWYLYRIPLKEVHSTTGNPQLSVVENIRYYITGVGGEVHLRFAEMNLVGNQWQKELRETANGDAGIVDENDEVLTLGVINIEDNPEYSSPPGVFQERDRSKPDENVFKNEQSLQLIIDKLEDGDYRDIVKYLYRPIDVFNYKEMKMFVHGDDNDMPGQVSWYDSDSSYASEVYFRFGSDTNNYYEYRQPVQAGWNEISIRFDELTALKSIRPRTDSVYTKDLGDLPGHSYGLLGNPSLTKISFFQLGIINPKDKGNPSESVSGDIWINELRVLDAEDTPGWAYSASTSLAVADFVTVSMNLSQTNPYFHRLSERFGSRVDRRSWGGSMDLDLMKLIPANMQGSNFKIKYSHTESVSKPQYLPGTDVEVDQAATQTKQKLVEEGKTEEEATTIADELKTNTQTLSISDQWSLSNVRFRIPSNAWYLKHTINSLSFGFNYSKSFNRSPTVIKSQNWVWNANINYDLKFGRDNFFYPANIPFVGYLIGIISDYRNVKVYYAPSSISSSISAKRNWKSSQSRDTSAVPSTQRDFTANRQFSFNWKVTEGGLWNVSIDYNANWQSSLAYLLTDDINGELKDREESEIWGDIFDGEFFGRDNSFKQGFNFKTSPKLPSFWNLNRYFNISAGYSANYGWQNNFSQEELGRSANYSNRMNAGLTLRWKALTQPIFGEEKKTTNRRVNNRNKNTGTRRGGRRTNTAETEAAKPEEQNDEEEIPDSLKPSTVMRALNLMASTAQYIFFDYDQISANFSQSNNASGTGLKGDGEGFDNFWGITHSDGKGPGRAFMFGFTNDIGPRAKNGNLSDNISRKNTIDFKTSRPLWEGATIDLTWKVGWGYNRSTKFTTDSLGNVFVTNVASSGNIDRSFLTFPPSLFLSVFKSGITQVNEEYDQNAEDPAKSLSDAFISGFESMPVLSKIPIFGDLAKYLPRPNWRLNWRGLEKISFFKSWAQSVSLSHAYQSTYTEGWKLDQNGEEVTQSQKISYGFAPLVGLNIKFNELWGGDFSGKIQYNTKTNYDLGVSTRNITESLSRDINITASYSKRGFSIPLFGIALKNDLEFSFSYTQGKNSVLIFEMDNFEEEGKPQDGTNRTTIEPRIKYTISQRVNLSLFYKMTSVEPEGAARIPPTTTNEAGLDIHISIQ